MEVKMEVQVEGAPVGAEGGEAELGDRLVLLVGGQVPPHAQRPGTGAGSGAGGGAGGVGAGADRGAGGGAGCRSCTWHHLAGDHQADEGALLPQDPQHHPGHHLVQVQVEGQRLHVVRNTLHTEVFLHRRGLRAQSRGYCGLPGYQIIVFGMRGTWLTNFRVLQGI